VRPIDSYYPRIYTSSKSDEYPGTKQKWYLAEKTVGLIHKHRFYYPAELFEKFDATFKHYKERRYITFLS
jgi:hypothetical protein